MIRFLAAILLCFSISALYAIPVECIESSDGLSISWSPPKLDSADVEGGFIEISANGAEVFAETGEPAIPEFKISVVLPSAGDWSFRIEEQTWEPTGRVDLAPMPTWRGFPDGPYSLEYIPDSASYSIDRWLPDEPISFSETGFMRNIRIGHLTIAAIRYNPANREIERLVALRARIEFTGGGNGGVPDAIERSLIEASLNPQIATSFVGKKPRKRPQSSAFSASDRWFTFAVSSPGLVKIDRSIITYLGENPSEVDPDEIRVFDDGWRELSINMSPNLPGLEEIPLRQIGLADGSFDSEDALYFYARGPEGWVWENEKFFHHSNRFTKENYYWITIGGDFPLPAARLELESPAGGDTTSTGRLLHYVENDYIYTKTSNDIDWGSEETIWKFISLLDSRIDTTRGVYFRHRLVRPVDEYPPVVYATANGESPDSAFGIWTGAQQSFFESAFTKGINSIELSFGTKAVLFDYYEFLYWIDLEENNGFLDFAGSDSAATYIISGFDGTPFVFDISDETDLRAFALNDCDDGEYSFSDSIGGRRYYVASPSAATVPNMPAARELENLRKRSFDSDLLMLIPEGLENDLAEYIDYREGKGTSVDWVFVESVLEEFGFGSSDPTAIRDFLRYLWLYVDDPPENIMLVGDATWDPRGITDPPPTYCPAALCVATAPDDYFYAVTEGDGIPDYAAGRVPITTINEWRYFVEKVKRIEGNPDFGPWRTRFIYCADDERKTDGRDTWQHTTNTSTLIQSLPKWTEPRDIYLADYPRTSMKLKPEAQDALIENWNDGSAVVNYIGHGNYRLWTHEEAFEATSCIGKLENEWKLPVVVSASCEVGLFYRTVGQCIAEQLLLHPETGSVASVAATRMTSGNSNYVLDSRFLGRCWDNKVKTTLGSALIFAKGGSSYNSTRGQYVLFGDPCMVVGPPQLDIEIQVEPESLLAGSRIHVVGEVMQDSVQRTDFDGTAYILVYDSGYFKTYESTILSSVTYYKGGKRIFSGPVDVTAGNFEADFVVPIDVSYGTFEGKVVAYAFNESEEGVGVVFNLAVTGDTSLVIADSIGPVVDLSFDGPGFSDGAAVCGVGDLICNISDENGINLSGAAGHALTMTLDGNKSSAADLSPNFEYNRNSHTSGSAIYPMENLDTGIHTVRVKAWDNMGNSGEAELSFEVKDCDLAISNPLAYPNPFREESDITFNIDVAADIVVRIFTMTGRPVRKIESSVVPAFASIHWDGEDEKGNPAANGVYFVKIEARTADGRSDDATFKIARLK